MRCKVHYGLNCGVWNTRSRFFREGGGIHKMILLNIHNGDEPAEKIDLALNVLKDANVYVEALLLTRHVRT